MRALTEDEIRAALVNASAEESAQMAMPHDLLLTEWDYLDFFAWRDPDYPRRGYVLIEREDRIVGILLTASDPGRTRSGLCNICHTMQPGNQVALFSAVKAGIAGRRGDSVGSYICADLGCHDSVRLAHPLAPGEVRAPGQADRRLDGTRRRMESFIESVIGDAADTLSTTPPSHRSKEIP